MKALVQLQCWAALSAAVKSTVSLTAAELLL